jgi:hypothetical protein
MIEIDDVIVLLLGVPSRVPGLSGRLEGITRLEKMIFLLERETDLGAHLVEDANFTPYNYGPFSPKVYQEVETLAAAGLLVDSATETDSTVDGWERFAAIDTPQDAAPEDPYTTRDFTLTPLGQRYYEVLASRLSLKAIEELTSFKERFAAVPLRRLVRYVYQNYPSFTDCSIIRDDILRRTPSHDGFE